MAVLENLTIRTASIEDVPALDAHPPVANLRECHHADNLVNEHVTVLVATNEANIYGHVNIRWTGFRLQPFAADFPNVANMNGLAVWPEHQRNNGIGSMLRTEVEQRVRDRGLEGVGFGFYVDNTRAQRFYERHGYRALNSEPVMDYDDGTSALIVMVKEFIYQKAPQRTLFRITK